MVYGNSPLLGCVAKAGAGDALPAASAISWPPRKSSRRLLQGTATVLGVKSSGVDGCACVARIVGWLVAENIQSAQKCDGEAECAHKSPHHLPRLDTIAPNPPPTTLGRSTVCEVNGCFIFDFTPHLEAAGNGKGQKVKKKDLSK